MYWILGIIAFVILANFFLKESGSAQKSQVFNEIERHSDGFTKTLSDQEREEYDNNKKVLWLCRRAESFIEEGDYEKAIKDFKEAMEIKKDHLPAYLGLAVVYKEQNNTKEALRLVDKAPEKTIFLGNVIATKDNLLGEEFIEYIKNDSSDNSKQQKGIRVHDSGARVTNKSKANELSDKTPQSFREVQSLLTATDDYLNAGKKDSGLSNVYNSIDNLKNALLSDGYNEEDSPKEKMISYLSLFSDAFPNWQPEYRELNKIIPEYFNQSNSNQ